MAKQWEEMTPDEKQEVMFEKWLSPEDVEFKSPEAEKSYKERVTRIKDAVQLKKKPDRVPVFPFVGFFAAFNAGMTAEEAMYDFDKFSAAAKKYVLDFEPDAHASLFVQGPGKVFDILDYKLYGWPGHGVSPNHGYQCLEAEYMKADEYDDLIQDPSYFFTSTYFPRIFGKLEPFKMLAPLTGVLELPFTGPVLYPYGLPEVQAAYKSLLEAGSESLKWVEYLLAYDKEMAESGFPLFYGWFTKAPFDVIGDTLRGTRGIMLDMYRQPDKLIQALEAITPLTIKLGVTMAKANGRPLVLIPLHKGADGFMSDEQFKTFYWPTFRKMLMGIIDEGCVPFLYAEGGYNSRLEIIRDLPRGKTIWSFDTTDMSKAKKILGDVACIGGNMPVSLLTVGTPQEVKDYTKKLIDTAGKDGGYIMVSGVVIDEAKPENLKAMIDATKEYGVYK
jgi:hypothetical protein